jgi:sporulation protein YqfC
MTKVCGIIGDYAEVGIGMAKLKIRQRLSRALQLPADAALPVPRMEITGRRDVLFTGGAELYELSTEEIRVGRGDFAVTIHGVDLTVAAMDGMGMQIQGILTSIEFTEERG